MPPPPFHPTSRFLSPTSASHQLCESLWLCLDALGVYSLDNPQLGNPQNLPPPDNKDLKVLPKKRLPQTMAVQALLTLLPFH